MGKLGAPGRVAMSVLAIGLPQVALGVHAAAAAQRGVAPVETFSLAALGCAVAGVAFGLLALGTRPVRPSPARNLLDVLHVASLVVATWVALSSVVAALAALRH